MGTVCFCSLESSDIIFPHFYVQAPLLSVLFDYGIDPYINYRNVTRIRFFMFIQFTKQRFKMFHHDLHVSFVMSLTFTNDYKPH